MKAHLTWGEPPGVVYESVYYFEKLGSEKLGSERGFFTLSVHEARVVRAYEEEKACLGRLIEDVITEFKQNGYEVHQAV